MITDPRCENCDSDKDVKLTDWGETLCPKCIKTIDAMDRMDDEAMRSTYQHIYGDPDGE